MIKRFEERKQELIDQGYDEENIRIKKAIVFFATAYSIAEGGHTNEGVSVSFSFSKHLEPFKAPNSNAVGIRVGKASFTPDRITQIKTAPGLYDFLCVDMPNSTGQMVAKPVDLNFLSMIHTVYDDPALNPVIVSADPVKESVAAVTGSTDKKTVVK